MFEKEACKIVTCRSRGLSTTTPAVVCDRQHNATLVDGRSRLVMLREPMMRSQRRSFRGYMLQVNAGPPFSARTNTYIEQARKVNVPACCDGFAIE